MSTADPQTLPLPDAGPPLTSVLPAPEAEPDNMPGALPDSVDSGAPTAASAAAPAVHEDKKVPDADLADEPQNALTRKFTDNEWTALRQFRTKLPTVFENAYVDSEHASRKTEPYTMWGVPIAPSAAVPTDARVSVLLMKFLRARNLNADSAAEMLTATLRWRDEFELEDVMKETFDEKIYGGLGKIYGKDKLGQPVVYNLYGANPGAFNDVKTFIRWRVQFMEKAIELLDFESVDQMIQIHDYAGAKRDTNSKNAASEATSIFGSHYPEFVAPHGKFFVNMSTLVTWMFYLFKPLMSAATAAKLTMVGQGPQTIGKALLPQIDAGQLPKQYGGTAEAW